MDERPRQIQLRRVEVRQHVNLVAREILDLIELVANGDARRQVTHRRELRIVDDDGAVGDAPRMLVEAAAEHLAELRPREERRRRRMRRHEPLPVVAHEREQIGALLRREVDLADAEEEDRVEVVQVANVELLAGRDAGAGRET